MVYGCATISGRASVRNSTRLEYKKSKIFSIIIFFLFLC